MPKKYDSKGFFFRKDLAIVYAEFARKLGFPGASVTAVMERALREFSILAMTPPESRTLPPLVQALDDAARAEMSPKPFPPADAHRAESHDTPTVVE